MKPLPGWSLRRFLRLELGIHFPLTREERALCLEARAVWEASPNTPRHWVASRYAADGVTYAKCTNGVVELCRFIEPPRIVKL